MSTTRHSPVNPGYISYFSGSQIEEIGHNVTARTVQVISAWSVIVCIWAALLWMLFRLN